jgi:hypothetical protein
VKKVKWQTEEMVALVALYFENKKNKYVDFEKRLDELSKTLNFRAGVLEIDCDDKFRNLNGMKTTIANILYVDSKGCEGLGNCGEMVYYVVYMYKVDKNRFDAILKDFNEKYSLQSRSGNYK